ncbi:nucleosome assembly protein 1-like 1-A isoform X2 [Rhodnius prolixus]
MPGGTEDGGRGEKLTDESGEENPVDKFLKSTNAVEGTLSNMYARDQLLMLYALPQPIKKRIRALKKQQVSIINMEANFYNDIHNIEMKYYQQYKAIFDKRAKIIAGKYEPSEDELHPEPKVPDMTPEVEARLKMEQEKIPEGPGVPNFWLTIFRNVGVLNDVTYPQDDDILKHLVDIRVTLNNNPMGFLLEFMFTPNDYFTNTVLSKEYFMKCKPDEEDPFSFEGPEIYKTKGCTIDWNPGKDLTTKTVKKRQKHKSKGTIRTVMKTVKNETFFNFFSPPQVPDDTAGEIDEEVQIALTSDFEIGHFLKEQVIPHAILYYTGEALEEDDSYEDDDEEEDEEESGSRSASSTEEEQRSGNPSESAESAQ